MKESSKWTLHIIAAVVIFFLLGLHMIIMHMQTLLGWFGLGTENVVSFEAVVQRGQRISFTVIYVLLLGAALYHGLYGLRNILLELVPGRGAQRGFSAALTVIGLGLFALGAYAAIAAFSMSG